MNVIESPHMVQAQVREWQKTGRVALVPTMGALHEGHLSLIRLAKRHADRCIVSVFVNPMQFAPSEDLSNYPRPFAADRAKLEAEGVDLMFAPTPVQMYNDRYQTSVNLSLLTRHLCGASRPGHFEGVATVCLKLFHISRADVAVFGEKDFQQVRVIEQLVEDTNLDMKVLRAPLVRDSDGLALSSRNVYLSPQDRMRALSISQSLFAWQEQWKSAALVGDVIADIERRLETTGLRKDYVVIASETDLTPCEAETPCGEIVAPRLFIAAFAGTTRLIDNGALYSAGAK